MVKPYQKSAVSMVLENAIRHAVEIKAKETQIVSMKALFTEYKACEWERGKCIGTGASGAVYMATSVLTGGVMAVKIVPIDTSDPEITAKSEDILNEINILRTMDHPNVIHYFCCERSEHTVNIFMEYAERGSLESLMKSSIRQTAIQRILREVLQAVAYIHDRGIIHRDIKSANILVSARGVKKLADFGSACLLKDGFARGTKGTMRWMAPEVMRNTEPYTTACDIWSIGCLLIELITNAPPFQNISESDIGVFTYISDLPMDENVKTGLVDLRPHAESFLQSCLQTDPNMRSNARTLLAHPFLARRPHTKRQQSSQSELGDWTSKGSGTHSSTVSYPPRASSKDSGDRNASLRKSVSGQSAQLSKNRLPFQMLLQQLAVVTPQSLAIEPIDGRRFSSPSTE
jgi:serine/threonine protein kinase